MTQLLDEIFAGAFDHTGGNRPAFLEVFIVTHMIPLPVQIGSNLLDRFSLLSGPSDGQE